MTQAIILIAAIDRKRALGKDNDLLYKIPDDLKRFRALTAGHPVIMGRKTWESLPANVRPMPNRTNIVITRQQRYSAPGAIVVSSVDSALTAARTAPGAEEIFVIGGGDIYTAALPYADLLYLTLVDAEQPADAFFPTYESAFTKIISEESREWNGLNYRWLTLEHS